jgi:threonine dehydrogenase-like Zn-dependent dehydrogenase
MAQLHPGATVAVFGCGPVGQFAIASCKLLGAGRIFAVDAEDARLAHARQQGAEVINFLVDDPVEVIRELTGGIGVDRAIDAVGLDAVRPEVGPAARKLAKQRAAFDAELAAEAPEIHPHDGHWVPGNAPSLALTWAVESLAKAGTLSIIGVYGSANRVFPIGAVMNRNITVRAGNCNHRRYIPALIDKVLAGAIDVSTFVTQREPLSSAVEAYRAFDAREPSWIKVELEPSA